MIRKKLIPAALALAVSGAHAAGTGSYIEPSIGLGIASDQSISDSGIELDLDAKAGLAIGLTYGFPIGDTATGEIEVGHQKVKADYTATLATGEVTGEGDFTALSVTANYVRQLSDTGLVPEIGFGLGYAWLDDACFSIEGVPDRICSDETDDDWLAQGILGLVYGLSENVDGTIRYRWQQYGSFSSEDRLHRLTLGLRIHF